MPYLSLAEQYDELQPLNSLVDRLLLSESPLEALKLEIILNQEIYRIREAASRDVLVFGPHFRHYVRHHVKSTQKLIIRLIELDQQLKRALVLSEKHNWLCLVFNQLTEKLKELIVFFEALSDQKIR